MTTDGIRTHARYKPRTYKTLKSRQSRCHRPIEHSTTVAEWFKAFPPDKNCRDFKVLYARGSLRAWVRIPSVVIFVYSQLNQLRLYVFMFVFDTEAVIAITWECLLTVSVRIRTSIATVWL